MNNHLSALIFFLALLQELLKPAILRFLQFTAKQLTSDRYIFYNLTKIQIINKT
jgi:hypothetical protein